MSKMPEIENRREFTGSDKRGSFIMRLVAEKEAKYGHIRVYRNNNVDDVKVMRKWKVKLLYWIAKKVYGRL